MEFLAENIKCNGCVNNIKKGLKDIEGVSDINVDIPTGKVEFAYSGNENRKYFAQLLSDLGYPEKGTKNKFSIFGRW
ncbi:MAG TPA: heavy-metal-associated domain-containing protein [Saprospiraceae bacterium]|nr:heavy-metal-associated domain-containing protein [Saprospiraceae bacterium]